MASMTSPWNTCEKRLRAPTCAFNALWLTEAPVGMTWKKLALSGSA
jgi:hypothetical protein